MEKRPEVSLLLRNQKLSFSLSEMKPYIIKLWNVYIILIESDFDVCFVMIRKKERELAKFSWQRFHILQAYHLLEKQKNLRNIQKNLRNIVYLCNDWEKQSKLETLQKLIIGKSFFFAKDFISFVLIFCNSKTLQVWKKCAPYFTQLDIFRNFLVKETWHYFVKK